jgi:hypothetical protein
VDVPSRNRLALRESEYTDFTIKLFSTSSQGFSSIDQDLTMLETEKVVLFAYAGVCPTTGKLLSSVLAGLSCDLPLDSPNCLVVPSTS